jgi:hypothetical protein
VTKKRKRSEIKNIGETPRQKKAREAREHDLAVMRVKDPRLESPLGGGRVRPIFYDEDDT